MRLLLVVWEPVAEKAVSRDLAVRTSQYSSGLALAANSLCRWQEKRMLRKPEVPVENFGDSHSSATKLIRVDARGQRTYVSFTGRNFHLTHEVNLCQHRSPIIVAPAQLQLFSP